MALPNRQNVRISRGIRPLPPIVLAGGGGRDPDQQEATEKTEKSKRRLSAHFSLFSLFSPVHYFVLHTLQATSH
jgi:hypothetical protein